MRFLCGIREDSFALCVEMEEKASFAVATADRCVNLFNIMFVISEKKAPDSSGAFSIIFDSKS